MATAVANASLNGGMQSPGMKLLGGHVNVTHDKAARVVSINLTEEAVLFAYVSGITFLMGGLIAGCAAYRRQQRLSRKVEVCACASCKGMYRARKILGTGGYGSAHLVMRAGKPYVLKMVGCDSINEANAALTEAACLQRLNHPNVVKFVDVFLHRSAATGAKSVSIVMEFCAGGDLIDRLERRLPEMRDLRPLSELQVARFLESLCHALHHVHNCGVLHRDLKSSNIFVSRHDRDVKLGDFGLAASGLSPRRLSGSPRRMSRCGTHMYMSPEVADRRPYGASSDTYGLGCVLLEMLLRHQLRERRPFETRQDYIREALDLARGHGWATFESMASLARRMLDDSPKSRIALPAAAAIAASAVSVLARQQEAAAAAAAAASAHAASSAAASTHLHPTSGSNGAAAPSTRVDASSATVREHGRPPKHVSTEERTRRQPLQERRRRLHYAE